MARYIDADKFGVWLANEYFTLGRIKEVNEVFKSLSEFPSEDVSPVIHAHWVHRTAEWNFTEECSKCHFGHDYRTPFCPICGAKMDEEVE